MTRHQLPQYPKALLVEHNPNGAPPRFVEYAYYAILVYGIMGTAWGLSMPPSFAGGMLILLAGFCIIHTGVRSLAIDSPIAFPLLCAISFLAIQVTLHDEPLMEHRDFVIWIPTLILLHSLSLRRGFLHRFAFVVFIIGIMVLPYIRYREGGFDTERAGAASTIGGNLANPRGLAEWFGFCAIYFMIVGIETKRFAVRIFSWLLTIGCLYVIGLSVSRGPLFGVAAAIVIALRRSLKRSFLPVLGLILLGWFIYELGVFAEPAAFFMSRGMEDSGRFEVWPLALARFLDSPLLGVGASHVETFVPPHSTFTPHNGFLFVGLASGVVPLAFYMAYWWRSTRGALRSSADPAGDAPFRLPLLTFAFLASLASNTTFIAPWLIVTLLTATASDASGRAYQLVVHRTLKHGTTRNMARSRSDRKFYQAR